ncbi:MAG: hypothetical protein ACLUOI_30550 [Eisenbergiella sp.]
MNQFQNAAEELEKEYQIFLDYIETNEVMISKATGHFGKKDCFKLNSRFHIVKERYKKAGRTQEYYTVIDFLYFFRIFGHPAAGIKEGRGWFMKKAKNILLFMNYILSKSMPL